VHQPLAVPSGGGVFGGGWLCFCGASVVVMPKDRDVVW